MFATVIRATVSERQNRHILIGKAISHNNILEKFGEGGMGVAHKAEGTKLGRTVTLKLLPAHLGSDEEIGTRLKREAKDHC